MDLRRDIKHHLCLDLVRRVRNSSNESSGVEAKTISLLQWGIDVELRELILPLI
uniref:Uncharacterized protein n=1 Tax=Nelumbo nucifera TaxID=4432 RepID=A0A822YK78_NELNU|nr:TPA_asm: hypothetical protein HUJ06_011763 [Nelumbo nucifera]